MSNGRDDWGDRPRGRRPRDEWYDDEVRPPRRRRSDEEDDFDDPRPRRRRRRRGMSPGAMAGIILGSVGAVFALIVVVLLILGDGYAGRPIPREEFKKITQNDTLESIEQRFGRGKVLSRSDLDRIGWHTQFINTQTGQRVPGTLALRIEEKIGIANVDCYGWKDGDVQMVVVYTRGPNRRMLFKIWLHRTESPDGRSSHSDSESANWGL